MVEAMALFVPSTLTTDDCSPGLIMVLAPTC